MRYLVVTGAAILAAAFVHGDALADATIAVAHPADDSGWALGISYSAGSRDEADSVAIDNCLAQRADNNIGAECRIVARFDNQCMALAKDTEDGGTAWGWGTSNAQADADDVAMANCQQYAGSRAGYCAVTMRHCDGE